MITETRTIDGRTISLADLEMIFNGILAESHKLDNSFSWKDPICYEIPYICADQVNDIITAIVFYVGGKCNTFMYRDAGVLQVSITNAGYYVNIGA